MTATLHTSTGASARLVRAADAAPLPLSALAQRSVFEHGVAAPAQPAYGPWPMPPQPECPREALAGFVRTLNA